MTRANIARPSVIALIPARCGSMRVAHKNIQPLGGHPLMAYTICAAIDSGIFARVMVVTDAEAYAQIARHYGAEVPFLRPPETATATSPDIEWVKYTLASLEEGEETPDCFSILRPTSPFRRPETIRRAWDAFCAEDGVDSLRAVEKCKQHPGKMWVLRGRRILPLLPLSPPEQPWHSTQYAALPEVFVQNASLEIAWMRVIRDGLNIAGSVVMPFFSEGHEGFDINDAEDMWRAELLVEQGEARLPEVGLPAYPAHEQA